MKKLVIISLISLSINSYADLRKENDLITDKVLDAMEFVESSNRRGICIVDTNGLHSYGSLQIQKPYLDDVNKIYCSSVTVEQVRYDRKLSRKVAKQYISYYTNVAEKNLKRKLTLRELIAIHNGGPSGYKKQKSLKYADKVINEIYNLKYVRSLRRS